MQLDRSVVRLQLPPQRFIESGSEPETEEDDPDVSRRLHDRHFLAGAADAAWREASGAGTVGLRGLGLEQRAAITRKHTKPRRVTASGAVASDPAADGGDESQVKWFYTVVAGVEPGSDVHYAGESPEDCLAKVPILPERMALRFACFKSLRVVYGKSRN